jgi:hypothetical protein
MATWQHLVTTLVHQLNALSLPAHVTECWLQRGRGTNHLSHAESAFPCFFKLLKLLACLPQMIWLCLALSAEVLVACSTSYSELAHMLCCLPIKDALIYNYTL